MSVDKLDFRRLFDSSPNPYMVVDRRLCYAAANDAYLRTTAAQLDELLGRCVFDVFPNDPSDPNNAAARILRESFERVLESGEPDTIAVLPYRVPQHTERGRVSELRYWSATHVPVFDEAGEVAFILQHTVDVTELQELKQAVHGKEAEDGVLLQQLGAGVLGRAKRVQRTNQSLDAERRHLRNMFEQAPGFMCFLRGRDHIFEMVNRSYLQLIGNRDVIGLPVRDALPEVRNQGFIELLDKVRSSGQPFIGRTVPIALQRKPGSEPEPRYLDFVYQPISDDEGSISGIFVQGHDITAQKLAQDELDRYRDQLEQLVHERTQALEQSESERQVAEAQLRQAQKMEAVGNLTGGVAHDFNNLLQVIGGNLQLLKGDLPQTRRAERRLKTAAGAVERGAKLAAHLLAFARRQPLEPQPVNLGRLVRDMRELLRRALGDDIEVETNIARGLWNTFADPNQIDNVILNLAINARDAMGGQGKLTIAVDNAQLGADDSARPPDVAVGQYVRVSISDTGSGMTPEVIERAFEPFFTTKPDGHGTGLGLSMVYGFVKQSGGHITIDSQVGVGTTLEIYLPRTLEAELPPQDDPKQRAIEGGSETILVVEDDNDVRQTVVEMLSELGYRLLQASDAQSALAVLQSGVRVDLLFTDVVMPGPLRSRELATQAKTLLPDLAVLFTSGYTRDAIVHEGRLDPDVSLLSKPYAREDLARKIRLIFERRSGPPTTRTLPILEPERTRDSVVPPARLPVQSSAARKAGPTRSRRVLLVEDDEDVRELVCEMLLALGHSVESASSAEEAEVLLSRTPFDILFTDITLPGSSGIELARRARQRYPALHVVIASGYGGGSLAGLGEGLEDAVTLTKPYDELDVARALAPKPTRPK